jgi:hypothetical protein
VQTFSKTELQAHSVCYREQARAYEHGELGQTQRKETSRKKDTRYVRKNTTARKILFRGTIKMEYMNLEEAMLIQQMMNQKRRQLLKKNGKETKRSLLCLKVTDKIASVYQREKQSKLGIKPENPSTPAYTNCDIDTGNMKHFSQGNQTDWEGIKHEGGIRHFQDY